MCKCTHFAWEFSMFQLARQSTPTLVTHQTSWKRRDDAFYNHFYVWLPFMLFALVTEYARHRLNTHVLTLPSVVNISCELSRKRAADMCIKMFRSIPTTTPLHIWIIKCVICLSFFYVCVYGIECVLWVCWAGWRAAGRRRYREVLGGKLMWKMRELPERKMLYSVRALN